MLVGSLPPLFPRSRTIFRSLDQEISELLIRSSLSYVETPFQKRGKLGMSGAAIASHQVWNEDSPKFVYPMLIKEGFPPISLNLYPCPPCPVGFGTNKKCSEEVLFLWPQKVFFLVSYPNRLKKSWGWEPGGCQEQELALPTEPN